MDRRKLWMSSTPCGVRSGIGEFLPGIRNQTGGLRGRHPTGGVARLSSARRALRGCQDLVTGRHRLTVEEISGIHEMVTTPDYRHVPTGRLAILAQRLGRVYASASTWTKLVRARGWRRPRLRVHPDRPKIGIRATKANQVWHVDTTIVRLLDGTRTYLHAVIDNFSRRILSWRLADRFEVGNSVTILVEAGRALVGGTPPALIVIPSAASGA